MTRFLIVPQWQGSPSSRGMRLIDGAQAIAGDLPRSACISIDVPVEAGESQESGVHRFSALARTRARIDEALDGVREPVMLVGGDCGAAVGAVAHAARSHPDLAVVWLDAHPDLHEPGTSESRAFSGMALRAVLGDGASGLVIDDPTIAPARAVLAGVRAWDDAERAYADDAGVRTLTAAELGDPQSLADAVEATGASSVYVHVDLDVLDPSAITGVTGPMPFGASVADVVAAIGTLRARLPLAGSSICGFAPASPSEAVDDMGAILRLVGALA